jgi:hypothetical protein
MSTPIQNELRSSELAPSATMSHDERIGLFVLFGTVGILSAGSALVAWIIAMMR